MGLLKLKPVSIRSRTLREWMNPRLEQTDAVMVERRKGSNPKTESQMRRRNGSSGEDACELFNFSQEDSPSLKDNRLLLGTTRQQLCPC